MATKKLKNELVVGNRSQAEAIVCDLLRFYFKKLIILPNDKTSIGKELDIYLPQYKIAFEIQGPSHTRKIWSEETFIRTVENDKKKAVLCEEAGIKLIPIYLPEDSRRYYLFLKEEIKNKVVPEMLDWLKAVNPN